jgi:hypothetical protein
MSKYKTMTSAQLYAAINSALSISTNSKFSKGVRTAAKRKAKEMQDFFDKKKEAEAGLQSEAEFEVVSSKMPEPAPPAPVPAPAQESSSASVRADNAQPLSMSEIQRAFSQTYKDLSSSAWVRNAVSEAEIHAKEAIKYDEYGKVIDGGDASVFLPKLLGSRLYNADGSYQPARKQFAHCVGLLSAYCALANVKEEQVPRGALITKPGKVSVLDTELFVMIRERAILERDKNNSYEN